MFRFLSVLLLVTVSQARTVHRTDDVTAGTELVMSFLIHRHGDRTPIASSISYSTDTEALEELTTPYGYGQLTIAGKQRAYNLGKYIRERYDELLSPKYNRSEVYIRSTDSTRAKMTVLTALSAIFPPVEAWNPDLPWEPVPYTTVPVKYDFNTASMNCPTFLSAYSTLSAAAYPTVAEKMSDVLTVLTEQLGVDVTESPTLVYSIYDVFTSQMSLGLGLGPELDAIFGPIETAAGVSMGLMFGVDEYIPYQAGVLLNEFYKYSQLAIAGDDTPRMRIYSAHDFNVYSFEAVTKVNRQGVPKYASAYSLEVRKVTSTGAYVVLPVYLPTPGEDEIYLQVEGCDLLCDYDQFVQLTEGFALEEDVWREKCGFTDDMEIDDAAIA